MTITLIDSLLSPVAALRTTISGMVVLPDDDDYNLARLAWDLNVDQHPTLILFPATAQDVAEGVAFARAQHLGIAIQSTGHGVILPADDCLLIITTHLSEISVNAIDQTAWVGAGVLWGEVLKATQAQSLAPLLGSSPGVGAVGYTLGGGMGWLARKYGLAADSVLEFEVVTADGRLQIASADVNPDLFWALRGGGSFAIVTRMHIRLYPVTTVYGGTMIYAIEKSKEVFTFYRDWIHWLPEEWTTSIAVMHLPPDPHLPPFLSGKSVVMVNGCFCGNVEVGHMMAQAWIDWMPPIVNSFHPMPFSEIGTISNDPLEPMPAKSSSVWLRDLSDETIDKLLEYGAPNGGTSPLLKIEVRYAGGAISRVRDEANAFGHRSDTQLLQFIGVAPTPDATQVITEYIADFKQALLPHLTGAVYMNFLGGEEARQQTRNAYPTANYQRLMVLKAKYDPENLFRFGYNIPVNTEASFAS